MDVLKSNFNENISKLVKNIRSQRDTISGSYGPLTLANKKNERPIFEINKEIDPEGYFMQSKLFKKQNEIPSILNINLLEARCMKDKVSPGYFILKVTCLSRIGGAKMEYDSEEHHE